MILFWEGLVEIILCKMKLKYSIDIKIVSKSMETYLH